MILFYLTSKCHICYLLGPALLFTLLLQGLVRLKVVGGSERTWGLGDVKLFPLRIPPISAVVDSPQFFLARWLNR